MLYSVALAGCGDDAVEASGGGGDEGTGGAIGAGGSGADGAGGGENGGGAGGVRPSAGCGDENGVPGTETRTLEHDGETRTFHVHIPPSYQSGVPMPVVFNFHGRTPVAFGEASTQQQSVSKLYAKGDEAGFIVVNPQGLSEANGEQTWNAGQCCTADSSRDDVGFVEAMLDVLATTLCVDERRVYSAGLSNGGMMSHRLACELSDRFAAIAPVAAYNGAGACNTARPVPVISFHGTDDPLVAYGLAVLANDGWVERNGCNPEPQETFRNGDSHCDTYAGCNGGAEVVFCTVDGGGHTWPGGLDLSSFGFGKTTQDLSANDAMWELFERHALP